jgi:group I intron endonuclease
MIIYKATNKINGKVYIGQTIKSLEERKKCHIYDSKKSSFYFHRALNKYDPENFEWEVLIDAKGKPTNILDALEIYYIAKYNFITNGNLYNLTKGGEGASGCKRSEETRKKISETMKGKPSNMQGKHHSKETRKKISEAQKGRVYIVSEETRKNISKAKKGKKYKQSKEREMSLEQGY